MHQFGAARRWREAVAAQGASARRPVVERRSACRVAARAHAPERAGAVGSRAARRTHHYGRRGSAEAAGRKQENGTADARRCTQMGWGPACSFGAKPSRPCLVSKAVALVRLPSVCIRVHLWFHISCCLAACRNFLLPCRVPHPAPRALGSRCSARPHAPARLPGRRCPPSHPACNETMASLTRDRSG